MLLDLTKSLITKASITPNDAGCQKLIAEFLANLGFKITKLKYGDVYNLWATIGESGPWFVFAGHTDVVPPGSSELWSSPPFVPTIRDNHLVGRGAADMKSSIAAMMTACHDLLSTSSKLIGRIGFLITSDEEGLAEHGTKEVVAHLQQTGIQFDYCLVGEATSENYLGDTIKIGRRGSLSGKITIHGKQGHIAYPHLASNPIHTCAPFLFELISCNWGESNEYFQPTQLQVSNIHAGIHATNVIPNDLVLDFNFRYSPSQSIGQLQNTVKDLLTNYDCKYSIEWRHSGEPYFYEPADLAYTLQEIIHSITGKQAQFSTNGGISDGRFLKAISKELVELGPLNASIHQIDENVNLDDLQQLKSIYQQLLAKMVV